MTQTPCGKRPFLVLLVVGACAPSPGASPPAAPTAAGSNGAGPTAPVGPTGGDVATAPAPASRAASASPTTPSSGRSPVEPARSPLVTPSTDGARSEQDAESVREQLLSSLAAIGARRSDPFCEPRVSADLAEVLYRTAKNLIHAHGDHVSDGELEVILPLLRLAAHSGHRRAQATYGQYIVGYYATDEMFWPLQPEVAADGLAMLRIVCADEPGLVAPEYAALYLRGMLSGNPDEPFPKAWLKRAQKTEEAWRRCEALP